MNYWLNLQRFTEEGAAAAEPAAVSADTAPAAEGTGEGPAISAGDTLPNGQTVSTQVAAAINKQMQRHPELRKVYGQNRPQGKAAQAQVKAQVAPGTQAPAEKTIEERWNELKKGEFAELFGRDVQGAIQDRFKNQQDVGQQLSALEPMLKVLRERAGVASNEDLIKQVLNDDSLYEEEAAAADMPVAAYKQMKQMQQELEAAKAREQQSIQQQMIQNHLMKLTKQAEEFKQSFPDFDLQQTLKSDPTFLRLTSPEVGLSVKDAYFAIHHDELAPQMMAYGMERAKQQMGQTLQAQQRRPTEGAMRAQGQQAAEARVDPRSMTRQERQKIYDMVHRKKRITFD